MGFQRLFRLAFRFVLAVPILLATGLCTSSAFGQNVTIRGFVTDLQTGQSLQGANVVLRGDAEQLYGAISDRDGFYQISAIPPGTYAFQASFIGYDTYTDTLELGQSAFLTKAVALSPAEEELDEVVVETEGGAARLEAGMQTVSPADLERIPTPDASGDLASYLQSLPGIVSIGDRGGQLFIRGGTPDQNLVLLDGMLVYQPFHIVGFFSAFPEDLISGVDVYAGGYGARYSGRISSVIDVTMREGNKQAFNAAASISPFLAGARVEGPIKKGTISFLGSVRESVIDRISPVIMEESLPLRFGEQILKVHSAPGDNSTWSVTALHTHDRGRIDPADVADGDIFRWSNVAVGGRLLAFPTEYPILFEVNTGISYVKNAVGPADDPERFSDALQLSTEVNMTSTQGRVEWNYGFFTRANWFGFRLNEQFQNVTRTNDDLLISSGGYVGATVPLSTYFEASPGLAVTLYPFLFSPSLEPRLRLSFMPGGVDGNHQFNAALGLYRQTILGISDERDAGSIFVAWMPAPLEGRQVRAFHALLGWQGQLGPMFRLATEGYYKRLGNLHVPIWSTIARFTTTLTLAKGDVYGIDMRGEFQRPPFYAYVGYGLSHTQYAASQDNFGVWFGDPVQEYNPPHDRRHQVNTVLSMDLGDFKTSVRWQFGSGLPFTRPIGFDDLILMRGLVDVRNVAGTTRIIYEKPYLGRLPTYHRLDVSVERSFPLPNGELTVQGGVINIYDRQNIFYYDVYTVRRVDQLPFLPYVSLLVEFH